MMEAFGLTMDQVMDMSWINLKMLMGDKVRYVGSGETSNTTKKDEITKVVDVAPEDEADVLAKFM